MNNTKAYLIYCIDNQNIANDITNDLGRVGIDFIHDTFDPSNHQTIRQQYLNSTAPIFLLVSDNFLKSENCMRNILELVEDSRLRNRIKTVILEGRHRIAGTNQYETVSTKFERLGDVVNYINYWSVQYQAIRTEMRHATDERKAELEPKLDLIQDISTNILGDFMRYLRGTNYVAYKRTQNDNFRQLFEEFGGQSASMMSEYRTLPTYVPYTPVYEADFSEEEEHIVDNLENTADEISEETVEIVDENVKEVVEEATDIVENQVEELVETTTEVVEDTKEEISDVTEDVLETTEDIVENIVENVEENVIENVEENVEETIEDTFDELDLSSIPGIGLLPNTEDEEETTNENHEHDLSTISDNMLDDLADDLVSDEEEDFIGDDIINEVFGDMNDEEANEEEESSDALSDLIDELADDILEENSVDTEEESDDVEGEHSVDELESEEEEEAEGEAVEDEENLTDDEVQGESVEDDEVSMNNESMEDLTDIDDLLDDIADDLVNEMEEGSDVDGESKEDVIDEVLSSNIDESEETDEDEVVSDEVNDEASDDVMDELLSDLTEDIVEGEEISDEEVDETEEEIEDLIDELTEDSEEDDEEITQSSTDIAEELAASGDIKGATGLYRQLVGNDPENVDLRYAFAMMLLENDGDQALAKEHLLVASRLDEDDEDILFALGAISEGEGKFDDAKAYYEKVILLDLEHEQAYYRLGSLLANAFDNQQFVASSYLQRAISLDDEYAEAYFEYAKLLNTYFGKTKKSAKYFKKAIKNNRHFAEAHFELAKLYDKMGKEAKALRHYEDAIEINNRFQTAENDARFGVQAESVETDTALASGEMQEKDSEPKGVVLITGATSGIGRATAELFARNGYNLIITGRREERLTALKDILEAEFPTQILTLTFDVRNQEAVDAAIASLEGDWKNVDILVNNAGLAKGFAPINEGQLVHWETMIDTNLKGLLYMTRAVSPLMVENGKGFIINIGSIAGKETYPNGNVYCATKAAVDALTKGMRLDLHQHNIRVTGIHPGHVETEFAVVRFDGDEERAKIYNDFQPLKASDVADTIYYVATRPAHVNIEDIVMWSTQQASATIIDKSGREKFEMNN